LRKIWQSSGREEQLKFEKSRLVIDVQSKLGTVNKSIRYRDFLETAGAVTVVPVSIYYAYSIPFTLSKIASVLIALWAIFIIIKLRLARKHQPGDYSVTYLEYLQQSKSYLTLQKKLLDTVIYWYILPCLCFALLFLAGFLEKPGDPTRIIITALIFLLVGIVVFYLYRRTVRKHFIPRLEKIDQLIKVMIE